MFITNSFFYFFNHLLQPILPPLARSGADLERLEHIERQLTLLWEQLQQRDHKQDERYGNILELYSTLKDQLHSRTDKESLGLWVSSLLDQRVSVLHGELEQEHAQRVQVGAGGYMGEWWLPLGFLRHSLYSSSHLCCAEWRAAGKSATGSGRTVSRDRGSASDSDGQNSGVHSCFTASSPGTRLCRMIRADWHLVVVERSPCWTILLWFKGILIGIVHFTQKQPEGFVWVSCQFSAPP